MRLIKNTTELIGIKDQNIKLDEMGILSSFFIQSDRIFEILKIFPNTFQ